VGSKEYFNQIAKQWDEMREDLFSQRIRDKAFSKAKLRSGQRAADIGAGTGFITEGLVRKGLEVVAIDQSELMLEVMRKKFHKFNRIFYRVGIAEELPIANNSVNYCFANMCLHHVDSPEKAIKEMARVIKPGGRVIITDLDKHEFNFLLEEQHARWLGFDRSEVRTWFLESGLKNIEIEYAGENCYSQSINGDCCANMSIFVASAEK